MSDETYQGMIREEQGGKKWVVPSGAELLVESGATLKLEEGSQFDGYPDCGFHPAAYKADAGSGVNSVALLKAELNSLLGKLRSAGIVSPAPTITVTSQPADLTDLVVGAIGEDAKLTAEFSISNGGTMAYQWYSNASDSNEGGSAVSGATNASYAIPTDATAGTTYYYCIASYEDVSMATDAATVTVSAAP